jgi:hypothetical protein
MPDPATDDFFAQRGNARSEGMHPEFYARLRSAVEDAEASTGEKVKFNSLTRTNDEQRAAYDRYRSGHGGLAAPPGHSQHEIGRAADIAPGKALDWLHENSGGYGLDFLKGRAGRMDPVHIQLSPNAPPDAMAAINSAIGAKPSASPAMAYTDEPGSLFRGAGFQVPGTAKAAPAPTAAAVEPSSAAAPGSLFQSAGFTLPGATPAPAPVAPTNAPPGAANTVTVPGGVPSYVDASGKFIPAPPIEQKPWLQSAHEALSVPNMLKTAAPIVGGDIADAYHAATGQVGQGVGQILQGQSATGVGNAALGVLGAATSPLTGAAHSLGRGVTELTGNPEAGERAGMLAGVLIPGGKGATTAVSAARNALPTSKAVNALVDAVGPENAAAAVERLRANPRLTWADVSDPVRIRAQGLIDPAQPNAMSTITDAVKQRVAEGPVAVNHAYTEAMGPAPDVVKMVEGLKERAREAGRKQIQPAIEKAGHVDVSPVIAAIDKELKPGITALIDPAQRLPLSQAQEELSRLRQKLVSPTGSMAFDAAELHKIQSQVGDYAYQLQKSASGTERATGGALRDINEKLIDQIDAASGGTYRPARAKFKDAKDIHESFDEGFDVLKNRSGVNGLQDRPEALDKWMNTATPEQVVAKRLGVRSDIDQKIRGVKNQVLAGTNITKIEYNREKLERLFGKKEGSRLIRSMEDASDISSTNSKLVGGSKTAETLAGQKAMAVREVGGGNPLQYVTPVAAELIGQSAGIPFAGLAGTLALRGAHMASQKVGQMSDLARNSAFARAALATGPAREETINRLLAHPKVVRAMDKSRNALTSPP